MSIVFLEKQISKRDKAISLHAFIRKFQKVAARHQAFGDEAASLPFGGHHSFYLD